MSQIASPAFTDGMQVHATDLEPLRLNIADHESRLPEFIGGKHYSTAGTLASVGATEVLSGTNTGSLTFVLGKAYELEFAFSWQGSVAGDTYLFQIKDTNLVGSGMTAGVVGVVASSSPLWVVLRAVYKPTSTVSKVFVGTCKRVTGSGTGTVSASTFSTYASAKLSGDASKIVAV